MTNDIHCAIYHNFVLNLGIVAGGITLPQNYAMLVDSLGAGSLNAAYITALRDRLTKALVDSKVKS